ncbi:MAG: PAS domain-containing protein [Candidatus Cloacimonetes bacterium]|nr:PAS domain-containing protein [Candidatus Cloacimonadota bacterium]MCF7867547.1 PAS domain-containing protein [Candidatus Cloacimonadota bacterium]
MMIQFKLRNELRQVEEKEEKKYRYKSRTLLKSLEEQTSELNRLRKISSTYKKMQISFEEMQKNTSRLDLLKKAIISIKHPVSITNLQGKIIFCNPEMANLFGIKTSNLLEKNIKIFFKADDNPIPSFDNLDQWRSTDFYLRTKGDEENSKYLLAKPELLRDAEKNPLAIVISFMQIDDITTSKFKGVEEPEDTKNEYQSIFDNMKDVYFELDEEGWIKDISPSIRNLIHLDRDQIIGKKLGFICTDLECEDVFLKVIRQQKEIDNFDISFSDPDGNFIPCSISARVLKDDSSDGIKIIGSIRNVTERKIDEEKMLKALRELKKTNKDLMDFANITSHDLKSPLRAINTLANWVLMDEENNLTEEGKKNMNLLVGRTERMHQLIEAIFEYVNVVNFDAEKIKVNMNKLIKNVTHKLSIPQKIQIKVQENLPEIVFERTRVEQIFENLIENSIKYNDKDTGLIQIKSEDKGSEWQFSVEDNGPGIDAKYFSKVFQIFQTLESKDDIDGTGIGLAIVKKIIDKYDGKIWLESEPGEGLKVIFTIPKLKQKKE